MVRMALVLPLLMVTVPAVAQDTAGVTAPAAAPTARPAGPEQQAKLDKIARGCKLKKGTFTIREDGLVDTHEPLNSTKDKMNCAYAALAKAGFQPPADDAAKN